jgi:hypothetical protein
MIKISINTKKITREAKVTPKGSYRDFVLFEKPDQYGNDGFVKEDVSKEEREAGVQGAIVGNWRHLGKTRQATAPQTAPANAPTDEEAPW